MRPGRGSALVPMSRPVDRGRRGRDGRCLRGQHLRPTESRGKKRRRGKQARAKGLEGNRRIEPEVGAHENRFLGAVAALLR